MRKPPGETWETFVEQQIRRAQEEGQFDHLPGMGQPLLGLGEPHDELWWVKRKLRQENLSLLPEPLQLRAEVHRRLQEIFRLTREGDVRQALEQLNDRIREATCRPTASMASDLSPCDIEVTVQQWRAAQ